MRDRSTYERMVVAKMAMKMNERDDECEELRKRIMIEDEDGTVDNNRR